MRWKESYSNSSGPSSTSSLDTLARLRASTMVDEFKPRGRQPAINNIESKHGHRCSTPKDCNPNMRCYRFPRSNKRCICEEGNIFVDHPVHPQCVDISQDS